MGVRVNYLFLEQSFYQGNSLVGLNVKIVIDHFSLGVDDNRPRGATGAVVFHYCRDVMGIGVAGGMGHGDFQFVFQLIGPQFIPGIEIIAFKNSLHGQKYNPIVFFK